MITYKELQEEYEPFNNAREAIPEIKNRCIIKRPGVFSDDDGRKYVIQRVTDNGFMIYHHPEEETEYRYDNLLLDYLFDDGQPIGRKK